MIKNLALSLASLLLFFSLAEIAARMAGYAPSDSFRWMADAELQVIPMPDQDVPILHPRGGEPGRIHINRYSQRGPDYPLEKAADELRIVVVGDSLTFGPGLEDDETYPALLQAILEESVRGKRPRVVNAGVNSWTTWHYRRWAETQLERFEPDVLVVGVFAGNDMLLPPATPRSLVLPGASLLRDSAFYRFAADLYRRTLWKRVAATRRGKTPAEIEDDLLRYAGVNASELSADERLRLWEENAIPNLVRVRDEASAAGVRLVFLLIPSWVQADANGDRVYRWLAERLAGLGVPTVDALPPIRRAMYGRRSPWLENAHLSPRGSWVVAKALAGALASSASTAP